MAINENTVDKGQFSSLERILHDAQSKGQFQRVLCVWLRMQFSLSSIEIARAIGWKASSVRGVQALFKRKGLQCFAPKAKGGRKRQNMSFEREAQLLHQFARRARRGFALNVDQIQRAYELSAGKPVARSTVYRLIARHGLRNFLPKGRRLF